MRGTIRCVRSACDVCACVMPIPSGVRPVMSTPRSSVQSSSLSICVEQQAALERGPMFSSLMRFRAPNLTGRWRKDAEESESLVWRMCLRPRCF